MIDLFKVEKVVVICIIEDAQGMGSVIRCLAHLRILFIVISFILHKGLRSTSLIIEFYFFNS